MKRRKNLIVSAITCMFSICLMMFGVYAATNPSVNLSGQVSYSVHDARVLVQGKMHGADGYLTDVGYPAVTDVQNPGAKINTTNQYLDYTTGSGFGDAVDDFAPWNLGSDLKFFEDNDGIKTIQLSFSFTNLSNYPVKVKLVDNTTVNTNVSMTKSSESIILKNGTSGNNGELTILLNVIDDSKSANLTFDFEFEITKYQIELWTSEFYDSNNNSLRIVGYNGTGTETQVVIPATVQKEGVSYPVKAIGLAIDNESDVTGNEQPLFAPKVLSEGTFNTTLTNVIVSEGITEIGGGAFAGCQNLVGVTLPKNVTKIGLLSFAYTGLQRFEIPNTVTSVGISAFEGCSSLKTLVIPSSVSKIGDNAFTGCSALETISVEQEAVANVACGTNAFGSASDRTFKIYVPNIDYKTATNWSSYKDYMVVGTAPVSLGNWKCQLDKTNKTAIILKYIGLKSVNADGDPYIEEVVIPKSVGYNGVTYTVTDIGQPESVLDETTMPNNALFYDTLQEQFEAELHVDNLVIKSGIQRINTFVFVNLRCKNVTISDSVEIIGSSAFWMVNVSTSLNLSNGLKEIGIGAFSWTNLPQTVTIPASVTTIGGGAFEDSNETRQYIFETGSQLKTIGAQAFACSEAPGRKLTAITIPASVETIGEKAFWQQTGLTKVVIEGNNIKAIGDKCFANCPALKTFTINATTPPTFGTNVFWVDPDNGMMTASVLEKIYVPTASVDAYKTATNWSDYASKIFGIA